MNWQKILNRNSETATIDIKQRAFSCLASLCPFAEFDGRKMIIKSIPTQTDQNMLLGIKARWGNGKMSVLVTHNLNSCVIDDISELVTNIRLDI